MPPRSSSRRAQQWAADAAMREFYAQWRCTLCSTAGWVERAKHPNGQPNPERTQTLAARALLLHHDTACEPYVERFGRPNAEGTQSADDAAA